MRAGSLASELLLATVLAPGHGASIEPDRLDLQLQWRAPAECPTRDGLMERIRQLRAIAGEADVVVTGVVERTARGFELELSIADGANRETRRLSARTCEVVANAGAMVVAVGLDARASAGRGPAARQSEPAGVAESTRARPRVEATPDEGARIATTNEAPQRVRRVRRPRRSREQRRRASTTAAPGQHSPPRTRVRPRGPHAGALAVHGGFGLGLVPRPTGGVAVEAAWLFGPGSLEVRGAHWFAQPRSVAEAAELVVAWTGAGLYGCYHVAVRTVALPACVGVDLAAFHGGARGTRVEDARRRTQLWVGTAAGIGLSWPRRGAWALSLRVEGVLVARRPALHLEPRDAAEAAYRASIGGLRTWLGVRFRWPLARRSRTRP